MKTRSLGRVRRTSLARGSLRAPAALAGSAQGGLRLAVALALAFVLVACATEREPAPAEWRPLEPARVARDPLPDAAERIAADLAAAALAGRWDEARARAAELEREDAARDERGELPSGLSDNAAELLAAFGGSDSFPDRIDSLLDRDDLDPALRRRLELAQERAPLALADRRMSEETRFKVGAVFNRVIEPLSTLAISGALNPIAASRSAIAVLLTAHRFPTASPRERQALRAWEQWLATHPGDPRAPEIAEDAAELRARLAEERAHRDLRAAELAADREAWVAARELAARAQRQVPDDRRAAELVARANGEIADLDRRARRSLEVKSLAPESLDPSQRVAYAALARTTIAAPLREAAPAARAFAVLPTPPELAPELRLLASFDPLSLRAEDATVESLERVPQPWGAPDTASRQAGALLEDPTHSAWPRYLAAQSADTRARLSWLAIGRFANGAQDRDLSRPVEYLLDLPGMATALVTSPLRLIQYSSARAHFGGGVLVAGERYVARHPDGAHADEVHETLEDLYALRGQPSAALRHAEARGAPDPERIAEYRAQAAAQLLAAADRQERMDVRLGYLAAAAREYGDTPSGAEARKRFAEARGHGSPQRIRLTREFLVEHPELWGPGALGLRPELLDETASNGELDEQGVTLVGRNVVEISLEGREPVLSQVPLADFARFVARLEQVTHQSLASDEREKASPDAARDAFLASSRMGVVDTADPRPAARSTAVFESTHEKHGYVRSRESVLPVDLVLRGDIETLGLAAFPRIRLPEDAPDTLLYE